MSDGTELRSTTGYHPVTKEELEQIIDLTERMDNTPGWVAEVQPLANKRMEIITTILTRPDRLALMEKWIEYRTSNSRYIRSHISKAAIVNLIEQLRNSPSSVIEKGISEGWWKP